MTAFLRGGGGLTEEENLVGICREPSARTPWRRACQQRAARAKALGWLSRWKSSKGLVWLELLSGIEVTSSCHRILGAWRCLGTKCCEESSKCSRPRLT